MNKRRFVIYILFIVIIGPSCTEVYDPEIITNKKILVVEGNVSDQPIPYFVRLYYALPYDETSSAKEAVSGASVIIMDDEGNHYDIREDFFSPGTYKSDPALFIALPDRSYSLQITTTDGEVYESSSQFLYPNKDMDTISGKRLVKGFPYTNFSGDIYYTYYEGGNIYLGYRNMKEDFFGFRYAYSFYLQATAVPLAEMNDPPTYYIWMKHKFLPEVNITGAKYSLETGSVLHELCFFPFEPSYYPIETDWPDTVFSFGMDKYVVMVDQYRLNEETYQFYKDIRSQLQAKGKLFDPVPSQIAGNIKCVTTPSKEVMGFFEVSAYKEYTYIVSGGYGGDPLKFTETKDMRSVPLDGYTENEPPPFWIK
jgi:hypothetical protein